MSLSLTRLQRANAISEGEGEIFVFKHLCSSICVQASLAEMVNRGCVLAILLAEDNQDRCVHGSHLLTTLIFSLLTETIARDYRSWGRGMRSNLQKSSGSSPSVTLPPSCPRADQMLLP